MEQAYQCEITVKTEIFQQEEEQSSKEQNGQAERNVTKSEPPAEHSNAGESDSEEETVTNARDVNTDKQSDAVSNEDRNKERKKIKTLRAPIMNVWTSAKQSDGKMPNIMCVEPKHDDSLLYCQECKKEHEGDCPVHGPLIVIQNMKVEENDSDRALHSLPLHLLVKESDIDDAGLGVFTDTEIPPGTTYGPYEGVEIQDPQLANSSGYCWQIHRGGAPSHFIDAKDTSSSNWMRYVNCAVSRTDQNLEAFQYKGEIYYRSIKPIVPKEELLVWYGDACAMKFDKNCVTEQNIMDGSDCLKQVDDIKQNIEEDIEEKKFYEDSECDETYKPYGTDNEGSMADLSDTDSEVMQVVPDIKVHHKRRTYDNEVFPKTNLQSGATIVCLHPEESEKSKLHVKSEIIVPKTSNGSVRVYDKKFFCLYCQKPLSKLKTHLLRRHTDEEEMADFTNETILSEKAKKYEKIRNLGNHLHNLEVLKTCKGELSVCYRKTYSDDSETDANGYGPCQYCFAWYVKHDLWRHLKTCKFVPKCVKKGRIQAASNMLIPESQELGSNFNEIVAFMKKDDIRRIVKSDELIMMFGKKISSKYGHDRDQFNCIRQNLRILARFLKEIRLNTQCPTKSLLEVMSPMYFHTIIDTVKKLAIYDETTKQYGIPSLAIKTGQAIKKCVKLAIRMGIQNRNKELVEDASNLRTLIDEEWEDEVTSNAHKTLYGGKCNSKMGLLPLADDVKIFTNYLIKENKRLYEMMQTSKTINETTETWIGLSEILLVQTIIYNRRRAEEISKMTLKDYLKTTLEQFECVEESVSDFERILCKTIQMTKITGKHGRTVAVLFPNIVKLGIDKLIETRPQVCSMENVYLFPVMSSTTHLYGTDCLRKLAELCEAKEPEQLQSTKLRKQIATLSQIMNLNNNELDNLAQFLGHDIRVHPEYYRLPEEMVQVAKVSKLLLLREKGNMEIGKSLFDIDISTDDPIQDSSDDEQANTMKEENKEDEEEKEIGAENSLPYHKTADTDEMTDTESTPYTCKVCHKVFEENSAFITHIISHAGDKSYTRPNTGEKKTFQCKVCEKVFTRNSYLKQHMITHTEEKPFTCVVCDRGFKYKQIMNQHMRVHTGERPTPYTCPVCGKEIKRNLSEHMRIHSGEKPYKCKVCEKAFRTSSSLGKHLRTHTGEKPYTCEICCTSFTQISSLTSHLRLHTGYKPEKCEICDKDFTDKSNLNKHMRMHSDVRPFQCELCEQAFKSNYGLTSHMRTHTGEKPYTCEICFTSFTQISTLAAHMRTHTGEKPFKCDICDKTYRNSSSMNKHRRTHSGEKPYTCSFCEKAFRDSSNLKQHMRIHTGERNYKCTVCTRAFTQSSNLVSHMRTHTGEKPHKCTVCGRDFSATSALKKHMEIHARNQSREEDLNTRNQPREEDLHTRNQPMEEDLLIENQPTEEDKTVE